MNLGRGSRTLPSLSVALEISGINLPSYSTILSSQKITRNILIYMIMIDLLYTTNINSTNPGINDIIQCRILVKDKEVIVRVQTRTEVRNCR
jgi:hypothetical protein